MARLARWGFASPHAEAMTPYDRARYLDAVAALQREEDARRAAAWGLEG